MFLVDSHCHLHYLNQKESPLLETLKRSREKGVCAYLNVATTLEETSLVLDSIRSIQNGFASIGVHPLEVKDPLEKEDLIRLGSDNRVIAIGETGLDFFKAHTALEKDLQINSLLTHIKAAQELKKPLIIHMRSAASELIDLLKSQHLTTFGVFHCFTESYEVAKRCLDLGFYLSFSGIITFKNAEELRDLIKKIPKERILIETDAPYLAPVPYRGKENTPEFLPKVAEAISILRQEPLEKVAEYTTENFKDLFKVSFPH